MPSVGNETNHRLDGLTVSGGLGIVGAAGATAYVDRDVAAAIARYQIGLRAQGWFTETLPGAAVTSTSALTTSRAYFSMMPLLAGDVVSSLTIKQTVVGSTLSLGKVGVGTLSGTTMTPVAVSADINATFTGTAGQKQIALTAAYTAPADGVYYAMIVAVGTTGPTITRTNAAQQLAAAALTGFSPASCYASATDLVVGTGIGSVTADNNAVMCWFGAA